MALFEQWRSSELEPPRGQYGNYRISQPLTAPAQNTTLAGFACSGGAISACGRVIFIF